MGDYYTVTLISKTGRRHLFSTSVDRTQAQKNFSKVDATVDALYHNHQVRIYRAELTDRDGAIIGTRSFA